MVGAFSSELDRSLVAGTLGCSAISVRLWSADDTWLFCRAVVNTAGLIWHWENAEKLLRFLVTVLLWQLPKLPNPIEIAAGLWHDGKMCAASACIAYKRHIMNTFRVKDGLWEMTGVNNALMLRVCTAGVAWLLLMCSACGLALQKPWWGGRNCCFV